MKLLLAVVALAGLSVFATAAPLAAPSSPLPIANSDFEIPVDPIPVGLGLNGSAITEQVLLGEQEPAPPAVHIPSIPAAFFGGTVLALSIVLVVSKRSLSRLLQRRSRVKRPLRSMSFI